MGKSKLEKETEQAVRITSTELDKLGYNVRLTEVTSLGKFKAAALLLHQDHSLAFISTVHSKEVQEKFGLPKNSCLILERDKYYFFPVKSNPNMIQAVVQSIGRAPPQSICSVCKARTEKFCWKCLAGACIQCVKKKSTDLQLYYQCPSCGTKNAIDEMKNDKKEKKK